MGELWWNVEGRSVEWVVVEFGRRGVVGDCCYLSVAEAKGRGRVSRRPPGVELDGEDVDYIGGVVIIVREVDVYGKAGVVMDIASMNAGDIVILDYH